MFRSLVFVSISSRPQLLPALRYMNLHVSLMLEHRHNDLCGYTEVVETNVKEN
jgi:hypothetical protein